MIEKFFQSLITKTNLIIIVIKIVLEISRIILVMNPKINLFLKPQFIPINNQNQILQDP